MALILFDSVRSRAGLRSEPPSCVPTATASYAAQASNIAVARMACARATAGGYGWTVLTAEWRMSVQERTAFFATGPPPPPPQPNEAARGEPIAPASSVRRDRVY